MTHQGNNTQRPDLILFACHSLHGLTVSHETISFSVSKSEDRGKKEKTETAGNRLPDLTAELAVLCNSTQW